MTIYIHTFLIIILDQFISLLFLQVLFLQNLASFLRQNSCLTKFYQSWNIKGNSNNLNKKLLWKPPIIILFTHIIPHKKLPRIHLSHKLLVKSNENNSNSLHLKYTVNLDLNFKTMYINRKPLTFLWLHEDKNLYKHNLKYTAYQDENTY